MLIFKIIIKFLKMIKKGPEKCKKKGPEKCPKRVPKNDQNGDPQNNQKWTSISKPFAITATILSGPKQDNPVFKSFSPGIG